jgi:hypothetical protein
LRKCAVAGCQAHKQGEKIANKVRICLGCDTHEDRGCCRIFRRSIAENRRLCQKHYDILRRSNGSHFAIVERELCIVQPPPVCAIQPPVLEQALPQGWAFNVHASLEGGNMYVHTKGWRVIFDGDGGFTRLTYSGYPKILNDFLPVGVLLLSRSEILRSVSALSMCPAVTSKDAHVCGLSVSEKIKAANISMLPDGFPTMLAVNSQATGAPLYFVESRPHGVMAGRSARCSLVAESGVLIVPPVCEFCARLSNTLSRTAKRLEDKKGEVEGPPSAFTPNVSLTPAQLLDKVAAQAEEIKGLQQTVDRLRVQRDDRFQAHREQSIEVRVRVSWMAVPPLN